MNDNEPSTVVYGDFTRKKQLQAPTSSLSHCLFNDTLEDFYNVIEALEAAQEPEQLNLTEEEKTQLDYLAFLADSFLSDYERLGFNEIQVELD